MSDRRLIFVVPELSAQSRNQYAHHASLLAQLARHATITAVAERGPARSVEGVEVVAQRRRNPVARAFELMWIFVRLRRRGYRYAYGYYSPYFGVAAGLIGRVIGIRTAYWHCRGDFFDKSVGGRWGPRELLLHTLPLVISLHVCARLVTGTERLADGYARTFHLPRRKLRVVPNDIDVTQWPASRERRDATVLFVGRLTEHKGAHLLPEYWRAVVEQVPGARLTIAGSGALETSLRREFSAELESGRVTMPGAVSNAQASALMAESTLLLLPSLSEGFPRVLIESMAAGLPFVATRVGGIEEIVDAEAAARLVEPGSAQALAGETARLLLDRELQARASAAGLRHVQRFDVREVAPRLLAAVTGD